MSNSTVHDFWNAAACGEEAFAVGNEAAERFANQSRARYALEPFIKTFANFEEARNQSVLEIGVGMGADHAQWAINDPRRLCGIDLTERAIELTRERLALLGSTSELRVADAEHLPFPEKTFGIVYSWGVLHHSSDTPQAIREVARVLQPSGFARLMIYHKWSFAGLLLWLRYGRLSRSLAEVYANHLESPGTKAYSRTEARQMVEAAGLRVVSIGTELSSGDLLSGAAGQRHQGALLKIIRVLWPRRLIGLFGQRAGLYLMIEAVKPAH